MNKKEYNEPVMEVIDLTSQDVICASSNDIDFDIKPQRSGDF